MKQEIAIAYNHALAGARAAEARRNYDAAFVFLERAHVLGQRYLLAHLHTHARMLRIGLKRRDLREIFGQVLRLLATIPAYLVGWVPKGNTGGSNVSAVKPMPLPADIVPLLEDFRVWRDVAWRLGAVLLVAVCASLVVYLIDLKHQEKRRNLEREWPAQSANTVIALSTTRRLTVTPVVNFHARDGFQSEPGVSYLVQTDDSTILFDLGFNYRESDDSPLEHNLSRMGIAPDDLDAVFLSHTHRDHIGGRIWESQGSFGFGNSQPPLGDTAVYATQSLAYPGSTPMAINQPQQLLPAVGSSGPIPRQLILGRIDEQALVINVKDHGLVLIVGCGHQTMRKLVSHVEQNFDAPVYGLIGDIHLPVPEGRLNIAGIDVQRRLASGDGLFSPMTHEDLAAEIKFLSDTFEVVVLGSHDTSDAALDLAAQSLHGRFARAVVGRPVMLGKSSAQPGE